MCQRKTGSKDSNLAVHGIPASHHYGTLPRTNDEDHIKTNTKGRMLKGRKKIIDRRISGQVTVVK
jgi:hypothetical protein